MKWNKVTARWNKMTWNKVTIERSDRIPLQYMGNGGDVKVTFDWLFQGIGKLVEKVGSAYRAKGKGFVKKDLSRTYPIIPNHWGNEIMRKED